jgi:hypothetical protein
MITLPFPYKIPRVQNGVSFPQVEQEAISQQPNTISEKKQHRIDHVAPSIEFCNLLN